MRLFHGFEALPAFRTPAVTVGSYDGVHLGHRALVKRLVAEARAGEGESIVVTFEPHPRIARAFAALSGAEFVERCLVGRLGARTLVAGFNHRFGHDGCDCLSLPPGLIRVVRVDACYVDGRRVSSTLIRTLLDEGRLAEAERLLGHPATKDRTTAAPVGRP